MMPSALVLTLSLALMTRVRAEPDAEPLTLILAPGGWSPGLYYPPDSAPSQQTFLNPQGYPGVVQQQRNLANFPRITEPARIQPHSQFFLKPVETLPVTQNLVPGLPNKDYYREGSVLAHYGRIQPSGGEPSNVGAAFVTQTNDKKLPTVFSPIPVRGNINNMINRDISNNIRNDQNLIGNNRNSMNDRFINSSKRNPIIRDDNSNINRQSKYNCSSDGIFPDIRSNCQMYFVCQGNQVRFIYTVGDI